MTVRVASNIAVPVIRQLPRIFNSNASAGFNSDPNTLPGGPKLSDAMGIMQPSCSLAVLHDSASAVVATIWIWNQNVFQGTAGAKGWVKGGGNSGIYTQSIDPYAAASIVVPERTVIFVSFASFVTNVYLGGCVRHPSNPNGDLIGPAY
jgi:hypothetical protein